MKEVKGSYERQLADLRAELKSLKSARKEHAKAMRKNVRGTCLHLRLLHPAFSISVYEWVYSCELKQIN